MSATISIHWPADMRHGLRAKHNAAVRRAGDMALETWWSEILPEHFEFGATSRYGYTKRDRAYQIRKARRKGHQQPMVWSGRLRDALLRMKPPYSYRGGEFRLLFRGLPKETFWRGRDGTGPDLPSEITAVDDRDVHRLGYAFEEVYSAMMAQ